MKKAVIMTNEDPDKKVRIKRNVKTLKEVGYSIYLLSPSDSALNKIEVKKIKDLRPSNTGLKHANVREKVQIVFLLALGMIAPLAPKLILKWYASNRVALEGSSPPFEIGTQDLILVEDIDLLPTGYAWSEKSGAKIFVDLRDYYWRDDTRKLWTGIHPVTVAKRLRQVATKNLRKSIYTTYLWQCTNVLTVGHGLASLIKNTTGVDAVVIKNAPEFVPRSKTEKKQDRLHLVYHGAGWRQRGLELLIEAANRTETDLILNLYLAEPDLDYVAELRQQAGPRIRFHNPLPYEELVRETSKYDIGVAFFPPYQSSLEFALPNKFFEYIQSRMAVISGPTIDMADEIHQRKIGYVAEGFSVEDLVKILNEISKEDIRAKQNAIEAAAEELNFEEEQGKLKAIFL